MMKISTIGMIFVASLMASATIPASLTNNTVQGATPTTPMVTTTVCSDLYDGCTDLVGTTFPAESDCEGYLSCEEMRLAQRGPVCNPNGENWLDTTQIQWGWNCGALLQPGQRTTTFYLNENETLYVWSVTEDGEIAPYEQCFKWSSYPDNVPDNCNTVRSFSMDAFFGQGPHTYGGPQ